MSAQQSTAFDWVKRIPNSLLSLDSSPLLGTPPPFPWEKFAIVLKDYFKLDDAAFVLSPPEWRSAEELFTGMEGELVPLHFTLSSLEGTGSWVMSKNDLNSVMSILFHRDPSFTDTMDEGVRSAFHDFIALEMMRLIEKNKFLPSLSPRMVANVQLPDHPALCIDITYTLNETMFKGRLTLSPELQKSLQKHFQDTPQQKLSLAENLEATVHVEAGHVTLTKNQWSQLSEGDFLLLDSCTVDPDLGKGRVLLTVEGVTLFRGMVKKGNIKILENPLYYEAQDTMQDDHDSEFDESEFEDSEFDESTFSDEDEYSEYDESSFKDESSFNDTLDEEHEHEHEEPEQPETPAAPAEAKERPVAKGITDPSEIPFTVTIELTRLHMSIKQLSELSAGNLLELEVKPEDGVSLIVNGKRIARAELLKIGEVLGARILEIG